MKNEGKLNDEMHKWYKGNDIIISRIIINLSFVRINFIIDTQM